MEFIVITGMSGAGKTGALRVFEDIGYYCVDNIPISMLESFYSLCKSTSDAMMKRVAVVVDVRGSEDLNKIEGTIEDFRKTHSDVRILFIDAREDCIIIRYKETRRKHPLADRISDASVSKAVEYENNIFTPLKEIADYKIDTTYMSDKQFRERILSMFMENTNQSLSLTFMSFGFKHGAPLEADLVFDVRCLPNPFYIPHLKPLTGLDKAVRDYVLDSDETMGYLKRTLELLDFSVPLYLKEGKSELVIAIGCTGGKHRSVTVAIQLEEHFRKKNYKCAIQHRDINK